MIDPPPSPTSETDSGAESSLGRRVLVNAGALSGSSLWRIGISFILQLLIARILGVQALGVYTVALAYLNVGQVVSELGLPALLSRDLSARPTQRRSYFRLALRVQFVAALLVWAALGMLAALLPYGAITRNALILIGASLPFYAVTSASQTLFRAAERMELVMIVEMFVNLLILAISVILLLNGRTLLPLIAVLVATQVVSALACMLIIRWARILAPPQERVGVTWSSLWPRTSPFLGISLAEVLQQRLDVLLLSVVAGPIVTGIYSAAYNLVRVLVKLIQSFWQALYPTLSRLEHEASTRYLRLSNLSLRFGLMLLLPCAALGTAVANDLIRVVYSNDYADSVPTLQWLIWITPVLYLETYAVIQLMIRHHPQQGILVIGLNLLALSVALPLLAATNGAVGAARATLLSACAGATTGLLLLRHYHIPVSFQKSTWMAGAAAAAGLLAVWLPYNWLLSAAAGLATYVMLIRITGALSPEDIRILRRALLPETK